MTRTFGKSKVFQSVEDLTQKSLRPLGHGIVLRSETNQFRTSQLHQRSVSVYVVENVFLKMSVLEYTNLDN